MSERLVTFAVYPNLEEAENVRRRLATEGIRAMVVEQAEDLRAGEGAKVMLPESELKLAHEVFEGDVAVESTETVAS